MTGAATATRLASIFAMAAAMSPLRSAASASMSRISRPVARLMPAVRVAYFCCGHQGTLPTGGKAPAPVSAVFWYFTRGSLVASKYFAYQVPHTEVAL